MSETSSLNDQIRDAISQVQATLAGSDQSVLVAAAYQAITHSIALSLQNTVAQQQHGYILRNALTAAAAKALLDGKKDEAEALLKLAESRLVVPNIADEVKALVEALRTVNSELQALSHSPEPPAAADKPAEPPTK